ncbi:hypothetical protein J2S53_002823 [Actinopolyspora lacussalsi]|nr:hypothetical protein [Actinopolyspora lacussalsi]
MLTPTVTATGEIGTSGPVEFIPTLREDAEQPATVNLSMRLEISLEDATAALWLALRDGLELSALDDEYLVHEMVLEKLLAEGGNAIAAARDEMNQQKPGTHEARTTQALRTITTRLYGTAGKSGATGTAQEGL